MVAVAVDCFLRNSLNWMKCLQRKSTFCNTGQSLKVCPGLSHTAHGLVVSKELVDEMALSYLSVMWLKASPNSSGISTCVGFVASNTSTACTFLTDEADFGGGGGGFRFGF